MKRTAAFIVISTLLCSACSAPNEAADADASITKVSNKYKVVSESYSLLTNEALSDKSLLKTANAKYSMTSAGSLLVNFNSIQHAFSRITFEPAQPWDWSDIKDFNIAFTVSNPGEHSVQLYLDITDVNGANYTRTTSVGVGANNVYYAKMTGHDLGDPDDADTDLNFVSGLRSNPDTWDSDEVQFTSMWGKRNLDLSDIVRISLSVQHAVFDKQIVIEDIQIRPNPPFNPLYLAKIVDKFGQNAKDDFDGKISSVQEMKKQRDEELASLSKELAPHLSKFSGWKEGPKLEATGYFRTEKYNGKWYLVDPEGYLYFATGIDIIRLSNSTTMTGYDFQL